MAAEGCQVGRRADHGAHLTGTQAACFFWAQAPCLHGGMRLAPGEAWRDARSLKCFCLHPFGVGCCDTMLHPVDFRDRCRVHYDFRTCEASLVQRAQPRLPCADSLEHEGGSADHPERHSKQPDR